MKTYKEIERTVIFWQGIVTGIVMAEAVILGVYIFVK